MAVKMMPLNEIDKRFLEDNLLTDEDMQFDLSPHNLDAVEFEENSFLKLINGDMEVLKDVTQENPENFKNDVIDTSILNFLTDDSSYLMDIKMEPLSPESSNMSSSESIWSNEVDVPVAKNSSNHLDYQTEVVISNTPPRTPPNACEDRTSSPATSENSVFIPVSSWPSSYVHQQGESQNISYVSQQQQNHRNEIKIQPKPLIKDITSPKNGTCNSFVLTPEQFSMLTCGTLKIKPPISTSGPEINLGTPPIQPLTKCATNGMHKKYASKNEVLRSTHTKPLHTVDLTAMKRQQRMIKNRESACLSRKKKKEHLQRLEMEIKEAMSVNVKLQMENTCLKQRVEGLEKENESLKVNIKNLTEALKVSPNRLKKTVGLMVVVFMLTMNLAPLSRLFEKRSLSDGISGSPPHHISRTLLWEDEINLGSVKNDSAEFPKSNLSRSDNISNNFLEDWDSFLTNVTVCPTFINRTESQRLDNDLRGLVKRVEKKQQLKGLSKYGFETNESWPPLPKLQSWIKKNRLGKKRERVKEQSDHGIMIYHTPRKAYEDFFDAIHRRDDTFYFVSFSGDHLLLPATVQNRTFRPRMSIVMPAMTINDSMGTLNDHVCMMQIDCEVMNTKLVYVKESVIPSHLRQKQNSTKTNHSKKAMRFTSHQKSKSLEKHEFDERSFD